MKFHLKYPERPWSFVNLPDLDIGDGITQTDRLTSCQVCNASTLFRVFVGLDSPGMPCCSEECATTSLDFDSTASTKAYETIKKELQDLHSQNLIPTEPTVEQKIDWAYGNASIENLAVTLEMVQAAVDPPAIP